MPEHTPAPTFARSVYGFVLYLGSRTFFIAYISWAIIPDKWLNYLNIYYYPQKYWAVAVPVQLLLALSLFAFFIYPCFNYAMTPNIYSMDTIKDNFSIKSKPKRMEPLNNTCDCKIKEKCLMFLHSQDKITANTDHLKKIPTARDLDLSFVCQMVYSK